MKRVLAILAVLALLLGCACAEDAAKPEKPAEDFVVKQHSAVVQGQTLNYTTTTGLMTVETAGGACEIFFMAYTLDGVEDLSQRPITFAFNGGPGSSSEWVQMGFLAPRRIRTDEHGQPTSFPAVIEDNAYSVMDLTDLVSIDPVGTGYSRPAEGAALSEFVGYDNDLRSVGDFIRLYTNRYNRWSSPKYVAGESYGTTRAVGLTKYLADTYSMNLNGIMLISCLHNCTILMETDQPSDLSYALYLPTYAADAWYHKKLSEEYQQMPLEDYLKEVRAFAGGEYLAALFRGRNLDDETKNGIAQRVAAYTGMKADEVAAANLRVKYRDFCTSLLKEDGLVIGRLDGRYTGSLTGGDMASGSADPSNAALGGIFGAAVNQYISEELGYHTDRPYITSSDEVNDIWSMPDDFGMGFTQEKTIADAMNTNRFLKVWVLGGYYDLATPFFSSEWCFDHVFINKEHEKNLQFTHYPSGHMIYLNEPCLAQFRKEAEQWYLNSGD